MVVCLRVSARGRECFTNTGHGTGTAAVCPSTQLVSPAVHVLNMVRVGLSGVVEGWWGGGRGGEGRKEWVGWGGGVVGDET